MSLVIYLGLNAFTHQPNSLLPPGQSPLQLQALQETGQKGTVLLDELTESAAQLISQWLAGNKEKRIQLLWPQPVPYIAALTAQGSAPSDLQQSWKAQAQRLVALFRKHRRQLNLYGYVPGKQLSQADEALTQLPLLDISPLHRLAAAYLLNEDSELQLAHAYLAASSLETSEWQQDAAQVITDALEHQKALQNAELENQKYLDQAQRALEQQQHELNESQKSAEKAKQTAQALNEAKEENSQMSHEMHKAQEALEKALDEKKQQTQRIKQVEDENDLVIKELHRVQEAVEELLISKQRAYILQKELEELQTLVRWLRTHAYRHATAAYRNIRAYKKSLPKQVAQVENSTYFNAQWYCEQYPDVAKSGMNPAEHYVKFGALEGRNPSADFVTEYYLTQHQDVAASGLHPLLHYVKYGMSEQRETQPQHQLPAPQQNTHITKERAE
ncbi:hypothetical protein ACFIOZ_07295 [Vreelandella sp. F11]|uniref:hypothetical protein n=1 Tax=Vreelandella sp. F11 TaxID=3394751 RepID=UPI0036D8C792